MKLCKNGHQVLDGTKFCPYCGCTMPEEPVAPVAEPVAPVAEPVAPVAEPTPAPQPVQYQTPVQPAPVVEPTPAPQPVQYQTPVQPAPVVEPTPAPQPVQYQTPVQPAPSVQPVQYQPNELPKKEEKPKKKKKVGLIIAIIAIVVVLAAAACLLLIPASPLHYEKLFGSSEEIVLNEEREDSELDVPDGYLSADATLAKKVYVSFLYEDTAYFDEDENVVTADEYEITLAGKKESLESLEDYFATFKEDVENDYDCDSITDIQKVSLDEKTLYRMSAQVTKKSSKLKVDRYVEPYEGFYIEYTVVSSDGAEGEFKNLVESLYNCEEAYLVAEKPEPDPDPDPKKEPTGGNDKKPSDSGSIALNNIEILYPSSTITSSSVSNGSIVLEFGPNTTEPDDVEIFTDNSSSDASTAFDTYAENVISGFAGNNYQYTASDVSTASSTDGVVFYYQEYDVTDGTDSICVYLMVGNVGSENVIIYSIADATNNSQQIEVINYILQYSTFK